MRRADKRPFTADLLEAAQKKLPKASPLLDLPQDRFHDAFACGVDRRADLGLELARHPLHARRLAPNRAAWDRPRSLAMLHLPGGDVAIDLRAGQIAQALIGAIATVREQFVRGLPRLPFHLYESSA